MLFQSLPLWERGLKSVAEILIFIFLHVAPLVGAWIEISDISYLGVHYLRVAPLVGAWIEITSGQASCVLGFVAPLVGAWIEIGYGV